MLLCPFCPRLQFQTQEDLDFHKGAKHKYQEIEKLKTHYRTEIHIEGNGSTPIYKSSTEETYWCFFCDARMETLNSSAEHTYRRHIITKKVVDMEREKRKRREPKPICIVCKVTLKDENEMNLHLSSNKHAKKVEYIPGTGCDICRLYPVLDEWNSHINSTNAHNWYNGGTLDILGAHTCNLCKKAKPNEKVCHTCKKIIKTHPISKGHLKVLGWINRNPQPQKKSAMSSCRAFD